MKAKKVKKKKKRGGKQSKSALPLVLGAGVLAYFYFSSKTASAQASASATSQANTAGGNPIPATGTGTPTTSGAVQPAKMLPPQLNCNGTVPAYTNLPADYCTNPIYYTPAAVVQPGSPEEINSWVSTRTLLYQTLLYDDNYPGAWKDVFTKIYSSASGASPLGDRQTVINELRTAVEYVNNFFEPKVTLDPYSPLGLAVKAMRTKYGIF